MKLLLAIALAVLLSGCVSDGHRLGSAGRMASSPKATAAKLVGSWLYIDEEGDHTTLTFEADGRFSILVGIAGASAIRISGHWSYDKEKILYRYEVSPATIPEVAPEKEGVDVVEEVTDGALTVLQGAARERVVFRRLQK